MLVTLVSLVTLGILALCHLADVNPLATNILVVPCVMNEACYTNACSCASSHMSFMVDVPDLNEGASAITKQIN